MTTDLSVTKCTLCLSPQAHLDVALLLYGPEKTALTYKMPIQSGGIGGALHEHWQHLNCAMLMPKQPTPPPPDDADEVIKVRWAERQLINLCFSADDTPNINRLNTREVFQAIHTKNAVLGNLREFIHLEAELKGNMESAKLRARRKQQVEEAHEEAVLPPEVRLNLAKADLRRAGYRVEKIADGEEELELQPEESEESQENGNTLRND